MDANNAVKVGDVIADKYRVERVLGRGGMGMVVAVWHQELHERRAIKFMLPKAAQHAQAVERFLREARAATRLKSSHAVKIHDVARLPTGVPYIVMEYLEGMDLEVLLNSRGRMSMDEACHYILQACEAIGEAHALGIVHRDLKPANLFITTGVRGNPLVKVLDFGIAKVTRSMDEKSPSITVAHTTMGTPAYMSPEHVSNSKTVDGRTDIWALGVMLYQFTTGALPFVADHHPVLYAKILDDRQMAPPPSRIHAAITPNFDAIVLRCLEKNIHTRYQTIAELVDALTAFVTGARPHMHSSPGHLLTVRMASIPLDQNAQAPLLNQASVPTLPMGPPFAAIGPALQEAMVKSAHPTKFIRHAIVACAVAITVVTGISVWIVIAGNRHDEASVPVALPAALDASMPLHDNQIHDNQIHDKQMSENLALVPSATAEVNSAARVSNAPALSLPVPQSVPKPTGPKQQPAKMKTPANKEFSTRK